MGQVTVRRVRPEDAARVRALRLEMLADAPLAYLETIDEAAARPHAEFQARIAGNATGPDSGQFLAEAEGRLVGQAGAFAPLGTYGVTLVYAVYVTPDAVGACSVSSSTRSPPGPGSPAGRGLSWRSWSVTTGRYGRTGGSVSATPAGAPATPRSPSSPSWRCPAPRN
jgi:hypothetical protein